MKSYNLDKLIKISVYGFTKSNRYFYDKGIKRSWFAKLFWAEDIKPGFYSVYGEAFDDVPEFHTFFDGDVWKKPRVLLSFEDEFEQTIYFDDLESAKEYYKGVTAKGHWLNIN